MKILDCDFKGRESRDYTTVYRYRTPLSINNSVKVFESKYAVTAGVSVRKSWFH